MGCQRAAAGHRNTGWRIPVTDAEFDFEAERARWPTHWDHDEKGWPSVKSTWRARLFPQLRVRVRPDRGNHYVGALVYWDGDLDGLDRLFTHDPSERWEIGQHGLVHSPAGIGPWEPDGPDGEGRYWRRDDWLLEVKFERPAFGGPDTWHYGAGEWESLPFFEPIPDWEDGK
jgi:hypothetical protein